VNGFTGVYDAQPHGATGSASGVGGVDLTASLNLGTAFTNVPGGTVHWTFAGGTNYTDAQGDVAVTIAPRPAVITANNRVKEYGDVAIFTGAEFAAAGFVGADRVTGVTLTSTGAAATAAVGAHPIVPAAAIGAGLGNYAIEYRDGALLVQDTTAPVLTLPEPISQAATAAGGAAVTFAVSASDRHDGALAATCTPASGSTFPIGVTTVTCTATDASGNTATGSFTVTITDDRTPGKMHGGGHVMSGAHRYDFNFSVLELFNGRAFGWFKLKVCTPVTSRYWRDDDDFSRYKSRGEDDDDDDDRNDHDFDRHEHDNEGRCAGTPGRFTATSFAFVRFSDDPAFVPGPWWQRKMMDTVVFRGNGLWNGVAGYRYEVTATDRGEPGRGRDTFKVTITAPDGTVVAQASAPLTAGNVQSIFLPDLSFLFELFPR
jgi:hypothetical protein